MASSHASGDAGDIFELFRELKTKAGLEMEIRAPSQARSSMVESSKFEPKERP